MSHHRLEPCPCAREWLAAMVEEGLHREDRGTAWLLWWLLDNSNLPRARARAIMRQLAETDIARQSDVHDWTD